MKCQNSAAPVLLLLLGSTPAKPRFRCNARHKLSNKGTPQYAAVMHAKSKSNLLDANTSRTDNNNQSL
jgi:hypothetical protein